MSRILSAYNFFFSRVNTNPKVLYNEANTLSKWKFGWKCPVEMFCVSKGSSLLLCMVDSLIGMRTVWFKPEAYPRNKRFLVRTLHYKKKKKNDKKSSHFSYFHLCFLIGHPGLPGVAETNQTFFLQDVKNGKDLRDDQIWSLHFAKTKQTKTKKMEAKGNWPDG